MTEIMKLSRAKNITHSKSHALKLTKSRPKKVFSESPKDKGCQIRKSQRQ